MFASITRILLLITFFSLGSCSTILKSKTYRMHVRSDIPNAKAKVYDSIYTLPTKIEVRRSKENLDITLIADTLTRTYTVRPSVSPTFLYLNLVGMHFAPLNYAVDFTNDKRFYYGRKHKLNAKDTTFLIDTPIRKTWSGFASTKYPRKKGDWRINVSIPYINTFSFSPKDFGTKNNTGFWGISLGADYFYKPDKFLNARIATAIDFFVPVPAAVSQDDIREDLKTRFIEFTDNFKFGRISLGYGLNYSLNTWKYTDESDADDVIRIRRQSGGLGISGNAYVQISRSFYLGAFYRPTLLRVSPKTELKYEHLISVELMFKIPIKNNKIKSVF